MRIALVSTGLGRVRRGFESFTESLFNALRLNCNDLDVTLFQGGGHSGKGRAVVPNFHRTDLPARWFGELNASHFEKRSFALALYPLLRCGHYDVVHYNELTMGSALFYLRRVFGGKFKLLYCNGAPSPPIHFHHRCDFAQVLTEPDWEAAKSFGIPEERLFPIPYGIDATHFHPDQKRKRSVVREKLAIPADAKVVLSVAALKVEHKRIDYLLQEVSALPADVWIVIAGQRTTDTASLETMAENLMPGRWRFVSWPHEAVAELYGAADAFVLCSLTEAFGLVTVEAMLSEVEVIVHNGMVFKWLTHGTSAHLIDMSVRAELMGALGATLQRSSSSESEDALKQTRETTCRRFSWEALVPRYLDMYKSTVSLVKGYA